jgi:nitric oxide reductase subunit B
VLTYSAAQTEAFDKLLLHYGEFFATPDTRNGLRPSAITDPQQIKRLTAFFSWSAWTASALRPNLNYSYTNGWPPEHLVGNHATADALVWSVLSLIALLGGTGLLLAAFGRWNFLGWHGREDQRLSFRTPNAVAITPAQQSCAWFFFVMAALFLIQALLGGPTEHYRAEITNFFGFDLARALPFNIARTWHVQLSLLWVSTSFLAAGIFLVPMSAVAFLWPAVCACICGVWQFGGRIRRNPRMDSTGMVVVRRARIRRPELGTILAGIADRRAGVLGDAPLSWSSRAAR